MNLCIALKCICESKAYRATDVFHFIMTLFPSVFFLRPIDFESRVSKFQTWNSIIGSFCNLILIGLHLPVLTVKWQCRLHV